jgi:hypothetical protein
MRPGKAAALHLDALKSTHPVRSEVRNASEAGESFDLITYEKGGEAKALLQAHPVSEAQQAMAQTLERLSQDVALRERAGPEVAAWIKRQP